MIKSTRRWRLPALLALGAMSAGTVVMTAGSAGATPDFAIERIFDNTRAGTAAKIAAETFPTGSANAILVREDEFADALAGNYLAGLLNAPILLVKTNAIPPETATALDTLNVTNVTLLGGTTAISDGVAAGLASAGLQVDRIAGTDRFDTAARIALAGSLLGNNSIGVDGNGDRVAVVSSGRNFPDALSAGPLVFSQHFPQLLTEPTGLSPQTLTALQSLQIDRVYLTGGTAAITDAVQTALATAGITVTRIAGNTRYDTSLRIAVEAGTNYGYTVEHVNLATGTNFPDALAGGPHGGTEKNPILLVPNASAGEDFTFVCSALTNIEDTVVSAHLFGGTNAIADGVLTALEGCGDGGEDPTTPGTGQVVTANTVSADGGSYSFVQDDDVVVDVAYDNSDRFTVDGNSVSVAVFEQNITPGDTITFTDDGTAADDDLHALKNERPLAGTVGNVNLAANSFDIINPVTGDVISDADLTTAGQQSFVWDEVNDNLGGTVAAFEGAISEGDTITVTLTGTDPTAFALVNAAVSGPITVVSANATDTDVEIDDAFGDDPATNQNATYVASAVAAPGAEAYTVDGATATYEQFRLAASVGDTLSYKREVVSGTSTETFALTNVAPPAVSGQVSSTFTTTEDPDANTLTGDQIVIVPTAGGYVTVDYSNTAVFKIGAQTVTETEFEAALSAGDTLQFQPGSAAPAVVETITLTNGTLTGQLGAFSANTDLYVVLATDKVTWLAIVDYDQANNQYFINGTQRTLAQWEAEVPTVNLAATDLDDTITLDISGGFTNHRLQTNDITIP